MLTRSQTKNEKNLIDFNEASIAWRSNKKSIGNGCYKYICMKKTKLGKICKRESINGNNYCKIHTSSKFTNAHS
jgi:hypothetical protein